MMPTLIAEQMPAMYAAERCRAKQPLRHTPYSRAAKMTPANPRLRMGWTRSAAAALLVLVVEPELVVDEPEVELEEDVLLEEWEVVEAVLVDLRLAELTVPLVPEEPLPAEPVGTRLTKV